MVSLRRYIESVILSGSTSVLSCNDDEFFNLTIKRIGRERIDVKVSYHLNTDKEKDGDDAVIVTSLYLDGSFHSPGQWIMYNNKLPRNIVGFKNDVGPYQVTNLGPIFESLDKYWLIDSIKEAKCMVQEMCKARNIPYVKVVEDLLIQEVGTAYKPDDATNSKEED